MKEKERRRRKKPQMDTDGHRWMIDITNNHKGNGEHKEWDWKRIYKTNRNECGNMQSPYSS